MSTEFRLIGRGVYSLRDAERLTGIPQGRLRRWTTGYRYRVGLRFLYSPTAIAAATTAEVGIPALDFADLIEARFLEQFRRHRVPWKAIRLSAERARELLGRHHPFSTRIFKTDGRTIMAELVGGLGDRTLLDLVRNQYEFEQVVSPMLYARLEFNERDEPGRWWPLGRERSVVIDPARGFGAPITAREGVPTSILAASVAAERSVEDAAAIYQVALPAVRDAVEFEAHLAA